MGTEIERKFLVDTALWQGAPKPAGTSIEQGYISQTPLAEVRVRIKGNAGFLCVKGPPKQGVRSEFEYAIPTAEAQELISQFSTHRISKIRYKISHGSHCWEVDVFDGHLAGLVVAEIELQSPDDSIDLPSWISSEVTDDMRYYNASLASASGPPDREQLDPQSQSNKE